MAKPTPARLREHTKAFIVASDRVKADSDARGHHFTALSQPTVAKRLADPETPFLGMIAWSKQTPPGARVDLSVFVFNSDTNPTPDIYIHVWVGSGNIDQNIGTFLLNVDPRFPRLTEPAFDGLTIASNASATLSFALKVPNTVEKTNYLGNSCLIGVNWHDVGRYLDRGVFVFAVN